MVCKRNLLLRGPVHDVKGDEQNVQRLADASRMSHVVDWSDQWGCDSQVLRTYIPWNLHSSTIHHIPSSFYVQVQVARAVCRPGAV